MLFLYFTNRMTNIEHMGTVTLKTVCFFFFFGGGGDSGGGGGDGVFHRPQYFVINTIQ